MKKANINPALLFKQISLMFQVSIKELSRSQKREHVDLRYCFFKIVRDNTNETLAKIGKRTGHNYTTVLYGINQVSEIKEIQSKYKKILRMINLK